MITVSPKGHIRTDPACRYHRPPRSWLSRWWFDRRRGLRCPVCCRWVDRD